MFKATGDAPILKQSKFKACRRRHRRLGFSPRRATRRPRPPQLTATERFSKIVSFLRQQLQRESVARQPPPPPPPPPSAPSQPQQLRRAPPNPAVRVPALLLHPQLRRLCSRPVRNVRRGSEAGRVLRAHAGVGLSRLAQPPPPLSACSAEPASQPASQPFRAACGRLSVRPGTSPRLQARAPPPAGGGARGEGRTHASKLACVNVRHQRQSKSVPQRHTQRRPGQFLPAPRGHVGTANNRPPHNHTPPPSHRIPSALASPHPRARRSQRSRPAAAQASRRIRHMPHVAAVLLSRALFDFAHRGCASLARALFDFAGARPPGDARAPARAPAPPHAPSQKPAVAQHYATCGGLMNGAR